MRKLAMCACLLVCASEAMAGTTSSSIAASIVIPKSCRFVGVPGVVDVTLSCTSFVTTNFTFTLDCNFPGTVNLSYNSNCVDGSRACVQNTSTNHKVDYNMSFNNTLLSPLTNVAVDVSQSINVVLAFDIASYVGLYTSVDTLIINF